MLKNRFIRIQIIRLLFIGVLPVLWGFSSSHPAWVKIGRGIKEPKVTSIVMHPQTDQIIYTATDQGIYKSVNNGYDHKPVQESSGIIQGVNYIYISPQAPQEIYIATNFGAYLFDENLEDWAKIFSPSDSKDRLCMTIWADENKIYIGTLGGVFYRLSDERTWIKVDGELAQESIFFIADDGPNLYLATDDEVYRIEKINNAPKKVFSLVSRESETVSDLSDNFEDMSYQKVQQIKALVSLNSQQSLYVATSQGIFMSQNNGQNWEKLSSSGLPIESVTSLFIDEQGQIFAGTTKGVFRFTGQRWESLYQGMETTEVNRLTGDKQGDIFAATNAGLFKLGESPELTMLTEKKIYSMNSCFKKEPSIQDVHQMAIEYAEVSPQKIKNWRKLASKKALLPNLSVGVDRASTELLHWDTGGNPDQLVKGRDYYDWDISVSWDLGDLIWSSDQTSIDSRSKLVVELRDDILDQITRLYFERRRLQTELFLAEGLDIQTKLDKQMRIDELTALMDALTGGEFSRKINASLGS